MVTGLLPRFNLPQLHTGVPGGAGKHVALGVEFARKYKEREDVIHAIEAHHNDVEPRTIVACLVQAADAISAARPGARRENLENYIKRLEQLETITGTYPGVEKAYAIQAGREVRVMVKPEIVSEDQMIILARDLAKKIEEEMEYPGQIKVHVDSVLFNACLTFLLAVSGQFFSLLFWRLSKRWAIAVGVSIPVLLNLIPWSIYRASALHPILSRAYTAIIGFWGASAWNFMTYCIHAGKITAKLAPWAQLYCADSSCPIW